MSPATFSAGDLVGVANIIAQCDEYPSVEACARAALDCAVADGLLAPPAGRLDVERLTDAQLRKLAAMAGDGFPVDLVNIRNELRRLAAAQQEPQ